MEEWSRAELAATVEAYLQMLALEQAGEPYNKAATQRMLLAGAVSKRTSTEHRMQNISYVLSTMGRPWINGYKPLENAGAQTQGTLREIILELSDEKSAPIPVFPPVAAKTDKENIATGYWMFVCKRSTWDGEAFLRSGKDHLLYKVAKNNKDEVQPGDLGVLRLNRRDQRKDRPGLPPAIYAIVQIAGSPQERSDNDQAFYRDKSDAEAVVWRVPINILHRDVDRPISCEQLPETADFNHFRSAPQSSTIPISRGAFEEIFKRMNSASHAAPIPQTADTLGAVRLLETTARNLDPKQQKRISTVIERGGIGQKVKALRKGRCQVCEAFGVEPVAFLNRKGAPYSEAHHVTPVSHLIAGSLAATNIMVLCANHHRQAHFGAFDVLDHHIDKWVVRVDDHKIEIPRTVILG